MTTVALIVLALLLPFVLFDLAARPTIRRLALRNVTRRPGEAALVVAGALLATALMTASFIIGDSFGSSIRNIAVDRWGPVDEVVRVDGPEAIAPALTAIEAAPESLIDGAIGASLLDVSVASGGEDRSVESDVTVLEIDPATALTFSGDADLFGIDATGLAPGAVVLNERLATQLDVSAGETVDVFVAGEPVGYTVAAIRPARGLNGLGELLATPGAVTGRFDDPGSVSTSAVLVSNVGDTFTGAELTDQVVTDLEARLGPAAIVQPVKEDLLRDAESEAAEMTELFGTVGGFSVAAAILLVINLFVMLAGERKTEMGTLRAVGLRRGHLVRALSLEGALYGLAAALVGVVVGIGVAAAVMSMAGDLLESQLTIRLDVQPTSLVSGAVIGLAVSQLTVLLTSWRVTRLNIVRALRDLPEPPSARSGARWLVVGALGVLGGGALYAFAGTEPAVALVAPALAAVAAIPLLARILPGRVAVTVGCVAALGWVAAVFSVLPDVMADPDVGLFLIQGVLLVALATVVVAVGDRVWLAIAQRVTGGGIASRVGLAEPLARPVRTALLVAMYALVIFTVTFMAVMNTVFQNQAPDFALQAGGGHDLYVDANPTSGLDAADLEGRDDVVMAAPVLRGGIFAHTPDSEDRWRWAVSGIDDTFLLAGPPALSGRQDVFATDAEAWAAVADGEPYLILDGEDSGLDPGDEYVLIAEDGSEDRLTVAGTTEQGWMVDAGLVIGGDRAGDLLGDGRPPTRFYLGVIPGADAEAVATELTNSGVERGIEASTFLDAAKAETDEQQGFIRLLQAYLGLGLLIGIAGLGVVLVRAVRERRRQFGVMRALGIAAPIVRRAFIVEAAFVAVQGVALGVGLGLLSSWQVFGRSSVIEDGLAFAVPGRVLVALGIGCLLASLAMAAVPAIRAGRTSPAVALRMTT